MRLATGDAGMVPGANNHCCLAAPGNPRPPPMIQSAILIGTAANMALNPVPFTNRRNRDPWID
jgi:hypothetical protein